MKQSQREYEIKELKNRHNDEFVKVDNEAKKFKKLLNEKEEELINEKSKSASLQKDVENLKIKFKEVSQYMSELPTKDEVKEKDQMTNDIRRENEHLKQKVAETEKKVAKAKLFIKEKVSLIYCYKLSSY